VFLVSERLDWDKWQREIIVHKGSVSARCGRQTGKSTAVGRRAADNMLDYVGCSMLMIAPAQRQSSGLFKKMHGWLEDRHREVLLAAGGWVADPRLGWKANEESRRRFEYDNGIYNEMPTKTTIVLKKDFSRPQGLDNAGSVCVCLPAGKTGVYLRFLSLDFLFVDEAAFVPDVVYDTLRPMLAISQKERGLGWECLLSTPFGKGGFFYVSQHSDEYKVFHVSAEDCPRYDKSFLAKERHRMSKAMYAQEYLAEFTDEYRQYFPTALIKECMTIISWSRSVDGLSGASYYLGQDLARMGGDEVAYVIGELFGRRLKVVKCLTRERVRATETIGETVVIDKLWGFKRIFTDSGGLGGPIVDLMQERLGRRRVVGLDNASRRFEVLGEEKKRGILKEDLYANALMLMETHQLELINDLDLLRSLKSITYEYTDSGKFLIKGSYAHLSEALVRVCWCVKERGLSLYCY